MQTARSVHVATGDANHDGRVGNAITARIAATRSRLLDGGLLQPVDWASSYRKTHQTHVGAKSTSTHRSTPSSSNALRWTARQSTPTGPMTRC